MYSAALRALCNDFDALRGAVLARQSRIQRIGWVDHSPGSWDHRVAAARAFRIQQRLVFGVRMSRREFIASIPF